MLLATVCFAVMAVLVKAAAQWHSTGEIILYRSAFVGVAMCAFAKDWMASVVTPHWRRLAFLSAITAGALALYFTAVAGLPLATAVTLNYMSSVWMAVFLLGAALVGRHRGLPAGLLGAVALGFAGVVAVLQPTTASGQILPALAGLGSGVLAAASYLMMSGLKALGEPARRVVFYLSVGGCIVGAAMAAVQGWHAPSATSVSLLLGVGACSAAGQWLLARAYMGDERQQLVSATLQYLGIAFSWMLGVVFFSDSLDWLGVAGIGLIVTSAVLCTVFGRQGEARA